MNTLKAIRIRLAAVCCAALLMICACAGALALSFPFDTVTASDAELRRSASANAVVLVVLPAGTQVTVNGESGNFYQVAYGDRAGYILKQQISLDKSAVVTPVPTEAPTATGYPYETTTNDEVNLRARASVNSDRLASIPRGAVITVEALSGSFVKVTYQNKTGFVKKEYVNLKKIVRATATPRPTAVPTEIPTPAPGENASSYSILQQGSSGSHVVALQSALLELGYLTGEADGTFGSATEYAVRQFQGKNDYPVTGIVDANLQAYLYNATVVSASGRKMQVHTLAPVEGVTITQGKKGAQVGTLQIRLRDLGYYGGDITMVYDSATVKAMKAFQKKNGLTADGVVGASTWSACFSSGAVSADSTPTPKPTPAPTPAPTFARPRSTVRNGSSGEDAKLVQQRLKDLGYFSSRVDGIFGSRSVTALKLFQQNNNLKADGVAGEDTYNVLFSWEARAAGETPTPAVTDVPVTPAPTPSPTPEPLTEENVVIIKLGVAGEAVARMQERLTALGYYKATVDSVCKADDVAAIRTFQKLNSLKVDGVAGYGTQVTLYSNTAVMYSGDLAGDAVDTFETLRSGSTGPDVTKLQNRLIDLGYLFGKADGKYGAATVTAVRNFQKNNRLNADGVAGPATQSKLYGSSALAATPTPRPTAAATPAPAATATPSISSLLQRGDKSDAVKAMQQRLIELGFLTGRADGSFGTLTFKALIAFQRLNSLKADGVAGPATLSRLNSESAISVNGQPLATPAPTPVPTAPASVAPRASQVRYANWYTEVKSIAKKYQYATVYDYQTGTSWQVHMFSFGAHADYEPLTAADTAKMERVFGGNTWNPRPVWVVFGNGTVYMASTHSKPHDVQHITTNSFPGHSCLHFPRTEEQVTAIGPYATSHQAMIDSGWAVTQNMAGK